MQKTETVNYLERYPEAVISFSPFALANMGILKAQTILKVDEYNLSAIPWQFGFKRGILAGSFSSDEIVFFQRFKGSLAGLTLSVQRPQDRSAVKIFCRCQFSGLGMMKDRDGIGLIVLDWKPLPPDLELMLGGYLDLVERLKISAVTLKDKLVHVTPESAKKLGYNNYAIMTLGGVQHKTALFALGVNRLDFLMPLRSPDLEPGAKLSFTLFFMKYRFSVAGQLESSQRLPSGVQKARALISNSMELNHILDEYFAAGAL